MYPYNIFVFPTALIFIIIIIFILSSTVAAKALQMLSSSVWALYKNVKCSYKLQPITN